MLNTFYLTRLDAKSMFINLYAKAITKSHPKQNTKPNAFCINAQAKLLNWIKILIAGVNYLS